MPSPGDPPEPAYGFPLAECQRIAESVRRDERRFRNQKPGRQRFPIYTANGLIPARADAGFAAGSVASPPPGNITFYVPKTSGEGLDPATGDDATAMAYNLYTGTVPVNAIVWMTLFNGTYYVVTCNC